MPRLIPALRGRSHNRSRLTPWDRAHPSSIFCGARECQDIGTTCGQARCAPSSGGRNRFPGRPTPCARSWCRDNSHRWPLLWLREPRLGPPCRYLCAKSLRRSPSAPDRDELKYRLSGPAPAGSVRSVDRKRPGCGYTRRSCRKLPVSRPLDRRIGPARIFPERLPR
jgi:hypothetical protein